jgi:hypothetical protein
MLIMTEFFLHVIDCNVGSYGLHICCLVNCASYIYTCQDVSICGAPCVLQVVGRPGGGGESDAAFTPSPPVVAPDTSPCVATLTLAHQTRIRTLYSCAGDGSSPPTENGAAGQVVPPLHHGM